MIDSARRGRRALLATVATGLVVAGAVATGGVASAHSADITATATCAEGGGYTVSYSVTAWAGDGTPESRTNPDIRVDAATNVGPLQEVGGGAFTPENNFAFSGSFHVDTPATDAGLWATVEGTWGTGAGPGTVQYTSVVFPTDCTPPPPVYGGCTPGYWKNHTSAWEGYSSGQTVSSVFSGAGTYGLDGDSLLTALGYGGGSGTSGAARILLRAGVASLLNSSPSGVDFSQSSGDVIAAVSSALASGDRATMLDLASSLDAANNAGCPL